MELKKALIEKCESEGILYAMVAIDRRTKEVILPDTLQGAKSDIRRGDGAYT